MHGRPALARTAFAVDRETGAPVESIAGGRHAWRFRPHFHAGDEVVRVLAGRARLRLPEGCRDVAAGDTLVVPAGVVHRFEPIDRQGWAFVSHFVPAPRASARGIATLATRATALLAERPSLRTNVAAIAQGCAVSEGHLSRTFRRETGSNLHNFHVLLALQQAKALLRRQASVVEAALVAGFYDQAHLNREFVRTYGMTPAAFRDGWAAAA
ncbi:AraC family transcriptional regulator [Rhodanobacter sp. DHG33]|uniref:AraC family transcriptional regulator n=1 Tax=Rhodanobacter sp. DHG33 TaxID=2775921 RepID=UPI00177C8040|nr:AraC family transcriptional regulator [Rhodanobacter sp. DHG33]MBD8899159.1 helix-turn-helix domain-containing protein [Rhodanobacter sp. DHG33]